ncbi:MAG: HEPN domain-containing protein [Candidatus Aenigmarchaeota archaeon]|nr:HEPN domain-containing protein [Candidatus Aenigmarchaeota archaeon]
MSHSKNKVEWCLKKAEKEFEDGRHKGLVKLAPDMKKARQHIAKAEHNLKFMTTLKDKEFSDWCGSAAFYSIYHSLLAILAKFGYESRNQECTFALVSSMAEDGIISLDSSVLDSIAEMNDTHAERETITEIREQYQYGTKLSIDDKIYEELLNNAKRILEESKSIIEE